MVDHEAKMRRFFIGALIAASVGEAMFAANKPATPKLIFEWPPADKIQEEPQPGEKYNMTFFDHYVVDDRNAPHLIMTECEWVGVRRECGRRADAI